MLECVINGDKKAALETHSTRDPEGGLPSLHRGNPWTIASSHHVDHREKLWMWREPCAIDAGPDSGQLCSLLRWWAL